MTDIFKFYFKAVAETESPKIYHRWCCLSMVGTILARNTWLPFGAQRIFPNQYIQLVGNPGTRKSVSIKFAKKLLSGVGYSDFSAEKTSKEKFLMDLQGESGGAESEQLVTSLFGSSSTGELDPRQTYIVADEFVEFVGSGNFEFLSLLGALWDWDDPDAPYRQKLKTTKSATIYQPTINILSGNTHAGLAEAFPAAIIGQGFMSRLILIYSEPSGRKITIPPVPDEQDLVAIQRELLEIRAKVAGPMTFTREALAAIDTIYNTWPELEDSRFKHYSTRRLTHLIKVVLICTAIRKSTQITVGDILLANTILSFAELHMSKAIGEVGRKRGHDVSSAIMAALYESRVPLTITDLYQKVSTDVEGVSEMMKLIQALVQADKIQQVPIPGSKDKGFLPKHRRNLSRQLYVDLNLLKGVEL